MAHGERQVVSKARVREHGEVYTAAREVNAMLGLVEHEAERIESRFLEPACGTGNFIAEVLMRKLRTVAVRYGKNQLDYERYAILAVSSVYGIDILQENVVACRDRLLQLVSTEYGQRFPSSQRPEMATAAAFILSRNIVCGNALTLETVDGASTPIEFSEWSPVNGSLLKRRDFTFRGLIAHEDMRSAPLFSDLGEDAFVPTPVRDFPVVHFLRVGDAPL